MLWVCAAYWARRERRVKLHVWVLEVRHGLARPRSPGGVVPHLVRLYRGPNRCELIDAVLNGAVPKLIEDVLTVMHRLRHLIGP